MELLNDKDLVMKQNEFGDYEGHCPWCDEIFYLPFWSSRVTAANPVHQCINCDGWVRLL